MISKLAIGDIYLGQNFVFKKYISKELVESFSAMTGDHHPLHESLDYSVKSGFDNIIAQGFLVTGFLSYVVGMNLPGENALILAQESKFLKPIYINQEIIFHCEVTKIDLRFSVFDLGYSVLLHNNVRAITGSVKVKVRNS